jgi:hypothetical protein
MKNKILNKLLYVTGLLVSLGVSIYFTTNQWSDIDFESGVLSIDKTLYYKNQSNYKFVELKPRQALSE